jgi:O-acetylhomoserine/O-acetylserine sulfhydrylase-like pyridoxal-dependent enzyme
MNIGAENQTVKAILFPFGIESVSIRLERAIANNIRSARFKFDLSSENRGATRLT